MKLPKIPNVNSLLESWNRFKKYSKFKYLELIVCMQNGHDWEAIGNMYYGCKNCGSVISFDPSLPNPFEKDS